MLKQGFKVITENLQENPQCSHGPTLLFQRLVDGQPQPRKFYACSACRDRKDCNFFLWADDKISTAAKNAWEKEKKKFIPQANLKSLHNELLAFKQENSKADHHYFCHSCTRVIDANDVNLKHRGHKVQGNISKEQLKYPTKLLHSLEDASKEAQFFFSDSSLKFLENALQSLKAKAVICVGTPRLTEHLLNVKFGADVLLIDIDWRYSLFYGGFCWYNMFNHHFLGSEGDPCGQLNKETYTKFLTDAKEEGSYVIVMDPPFGGRVEALAQTLQRIEQDIRQLGRTQKVYYLWIYPYFMEAYIRAELADSKMLDYKFNYTNHPDFHSGSKQGMKQGSPVRVFTNASPGLIRLPKEEGYHFCKACKRFVAQENKHCALCNACTSKDGRTYVHCRKCKRCVKPTWKHCNVCSRCCLVSHKCHNLNASSVSPSKNGHTHGHGPVRSGNLKKQTKKNKARLPSSNSAATETVLSPTHVLLHSPSELRTAHIANTQKEQLTSKKRKCSNENLEIQNVQNKTHKRHKNVQPPSSKGVVDVRGKGKKKRKKKLSKDADSAST